MHLTVEQALSVYPLSEGRLIAGAAGRNRVVKSVNVMDAPDITDWIKEGEMLFTTAYLLKDRPDEASQLLSRLHQCGSAGLGIKLGRFWTDVPGEWIEQADRLGFPLIELPYQFTFSDQMNGLFREEMKRSTSALQDVLDKQVRLMRFALHSDHIRKLFDAVADVVGYPMAVVGSRGQMVYNSSGIPDDALLGGWPWPPHHRWMKSEGWQAFRVPLTKQSQCTGFVLFFNPQLVLSPSEESLYVQAAELLAFHMNVNYEDYFELSIQRDFGLLIKRYFKNGLPLASLDDYADRYEIDLLRKPFRCVLTDYPTHGLSTVRAEKLDELKTAYLSHARIQDLKGVHIVLEEGVLSVFPDGSGDAADAIASSLSSCFSGFKGTTPRAAISGRKRDAEGLSGAFDECRDTIRMAAEWDVSERVVRCETLDLAFVFEQVSPDRMRTFCNRLLGGLLNKDPDYAADMLRTLETYVECDGQLGETAKKLFIHRNTATYRIEKLGEMLDVDFKKVNDLLRLKLAFQFRRMLLQCPFSSERIR